MDAALDLIRGCATGWVAGAIFRIKYPLPERYEFWKTWNVVAAAILAAFLIWGVTKTEQRLDWLEDRVVALSLEGRR